MKKILLITFIIILNTNAVHAVTLLDAIKQTFKNNTELNAERENIKISKEDLKISKADYLPSLTITGTKSKIGRASCRERV